jgi:hypothetical protein
LGHESVVLVRFGASVVKNLAPTITRVWAAVLLAVLLSLQFASANPQQSGQRENRTQQNTSKGEVEDKRDRELEAIVAALPGMSPEFGSDVAIRLAASDGISDRGVKINLLTRAFYLAESAQESVKRVAVSGIVDSSSGYREIAFYLNLDRVSLQSRAVDALLAVDAKRARNLFEQMTAPALPPLACEEPLAYDVSLPYEVLGRLAAQGFTAKERAEGRHLALLRTYVGELRSHAQVIPAVHLLQTTALSSGDEAELVAVFSHSLERLEGDERSFANAMSSEGLTAFGRLIIQLEAKEISTAGLLQALRTYLVANFGGTRCPEIARSRDEGGLPSVIVGFNKEMLPSIQKVQIRPIKAEEIQDFQILSGPAVDSYWQSSPSRDLLVGCQKLRFGSNGEPYTLEQRKEFSWAAQLADYVTALESWKPDNEVAADFFHEKSVLYTSLIDLVPEGPDRLKIIDSYVSFLELNDFATKSRIEWFMHVNDLIKVSHRWPETDRRELLKTLLNSRDVNLNLYAQLDRWTMRNGMPK